VSAPRRRIRTIAVVIAVRPSQADGIRDHTERLVESLRRGGATVHVLARPARPWTLRLLRTDPGTGLALRDLDAVVVQYNPFWYGRRGFAPGLPLTLLGLRLRARRATLALLVHENYIDVRDWRTALMGSWQWLQLLGLQAISHVGFGTITRWTECLRRSWPLRPAHHLPVGSNFPDGRAGRAAGRDRVGADDAALVLAVFGLSHPGRLEDHIVAAARAVAGTGRRVILVNLGSGAAGREPIADGVEVLSPGYVEPDEVTELLAATDLFLAAYADGVSTRRGTVMAALQHGLPVVGTEGHLTDTVLREARDALRLTPVGDPEQFAAAVKALAEDPAERRRLGDAGRRLYEEHFDWPRISDRLVTLMEAARR
jgi:glycosyltransferase involved in cell wall biosynthesis